MQAGSSNVGRVFRPGCGNHVGQIVFLAKHLRASNWRTLSIPRGQSNAATRKP